MKRLHVIFLFFLLGNVYSQCPSFNYSFSKDTLCQGDTLTLSFGINNYDSVTVDFATFAIDSLQVSSPRGMVTVAGKTGNRDLLVVKNSDGNYYLIAGFNQSFSLYNVGQSLLSPASVTTQDFTLSGLGLPGYFIHQMRILRDKNQYALFVMATNGIVTKIAILNFGNSLANAPSVNILSTGCGAAVHGASPVYFNGKYYFIVPCPPDVRVLELNSLSDNSPGSFVISNVLNSPSNVIEATNYLRKTCNSVEFFCMERNTKNVKKITFRDSITTNSYQIETFAISNTFPYYPVSTRLIENFQDKLLMSFFPPDPKVYLALLDTSSLQVTYSLLFQSVHSIRGFDVKKINGEFYFFYLQENDSVYYVKFQEPPLNQSLTSYTSGTVLHTFSEGGKRIIEFRFCQDTLGCQIIYDSLEVVGTNLSATLLQLITPCEGQPVELTYSANNDSLIDSLYWDMGDGTLISQTDTVSYIYPAIQNYTVTLNLIDSLGCYHSVTTPITINKVPTADFTPTLPQCAFQPVGFSNLSVVAPPDSLILFKWDFGDGISSTLENPTHEYSEGGNYDVTLIAYTSKLCPDTVIKSISVPGIKPIRDSACVNQPINLSYQLFYPTGNPSASWEIDGQSYTGNPLQHTFTSSGVHLVKIIATTTTGCQDTLEVPVTITNPPPVSIRVEFSGCVGDILKTFYTGVPVEAPLQSLLWDFDTTATADNQTGYSAAYAYTVPGNHSVKLLVKDVYGCIKDSVFSVKVTEKPQASFTLPPTLCQKPIKLSQQSSSADTLFITWIFPDSTLSFLASPTWIPDTGNQNITLIVSTSTGCADTVSRTVNVFPTPTASFYTLPRDSGHVPLNITLKNTTDTSDASVNFLWFVNSQFLANSYDTLIFIDSSQTILFSLIATNSYGCADTTEKTFLALPPIPEYIDLEILKILVSEDSLNQARIQLLLRNNGNTLLTHWQNKFSFSEFAPFNLLLQDSLNPQEARLITLPLTWDENRFFRNKYVCIETLLPNGKNDQVPENNYRCLQFEQANSYLGIYPNPAENDFYLHLSLFSSSQIRVEILSAPGQPLQKYLWELSEGVYKLPVDISHLPRGFYIVKTELNGKIFYEKLLVK